MKRLVYADHAATTPLNRTAFDAMVPFLREEFGNPGGVHGWAKAPREAVEGARATIFEKYPLARGERILIYYSPVAPERVERRSLKRDA